MSGDVNFPYGWQAETKKDRMKRTRRENDEASERCWGCVYVDIKPNHTGCIARLVDCISVYDHDPLNCILFQKK